MSTSTLCINCYTKPKYVDTNTGKTHDYCGRRCASAYGSAGAARPPPVVPAPAPVTVVTPPTQPAYPVHTFSNLVPPARPVLNIKPYVLPMTVTTPAPPPPQPQLQVQTQPTAPTGPTCLIPGCTKPPYAAGADYCSRTHRDQGTASGLTPQTTPRSTGVPAYTNPAQPFAPAFQPAPPPPAPPLDPTKACLQCKTKAKNGKDHFCNITCANTATAAAPMLLHIPNGHDSFNDVVNQFTKSWKHGHKKIPRVQHIYKIVGTQKSIDAYNQYRASVEARGNFVSRGKTAGNECRRWHGTSRTCTLGDNPAKVRWCGSQGCSLCCILQTSFRLSAFGKKTGWGRFGAGIYTSATASKSDDYSNSPKSSPYKTIILTKVVVGRGHKVTQDSTTLTAPPAGFDSVLGEAGGSLNYDELVVYRDEAVRPSYLVVYST